MRKARQISESLIDTLYESEIVLWPVKPRTYRKEAEKSYIGFSKKRKKTTKEIRRSLGQQIRYLRRNLGTLEKMLDKLSSKGCAVAWTVKQWREYWVIQELFRQQDDMYRDGRKKISDRIVSLDQPWVRPIVRGKSGGKETEFGMKINVSVSEWMARLDFGSFNAFHEGLGLKDQIEGFKQRFGHYPATVLGDKIYWTRENRMWLKERGIGHGGVPMGKKQKMSKYEKQKDRKKNNKRSEIEGKFGTAKEHYGMDRIGMKLPQTTFASINMIFLAMNLLKVLGKVPGNILNVVLAVVMMATYSLKYSFSRWSDKLIQNRRNQEAIFVEIRPLGMTF